MLIYRPFQERHAITCARARTHAKAFRSDKTHTQIKLLAFTA